MEAAAEEGDLTSLENLLQARVWLRKDVNQALHAAARGGNADCYHALLTAGASATSKDAAYDRNSLHLVLRYGGGNVDIVRHALANKSKSSVAGFLNAKDRKGLTPLYYASERGYTSAVEEMIKAGVDLNRTSSYDRDTALMIAANKGHIDTLKALLAAGADVNKRNFFWYTALSMAAIKGRVECMEVLIKAGAEVNSADYSGYTPLTRATESGKVEAVKLLIDNGANINQHDNTGRTPLFLAVGFQYHSVVDYLLSAGAEVNLCSITGMSPFLMAIKRDDSSLTQKLIDKGSDINQRYSGGGTAVHMACMSNSTKCLEYLLENHRDNYRVNDLDERGKTPLTLAAEHACAENVLALLKRGANPDMRDHHGRTPLTCTIRTISFYRTLPLKVVKILIQYGCDVNCRGRFDRRVICNDSGHYITPSCLDLPMEMALRIGAIGIAEMLWTAGAKLGKAVGWSEGSLPWYNMAECDLQVAEASKPQIFTFLQTVTSQPRTLADLCRISIRDLLGLDVETKVNTLCLPETVKDFVKITELDDIEEHHVLNFQDSGDDSDDPDEEMLSDTISETTEDISDMPDMDSSDSGDDDDEDEDEEEDD